MSERTLRNWQRSLEEPGRPEGRPPHPARARLCAARAVLRLLQAEGYRLGEGEVMRRLEERGSPQPRRLVRWALVGLKARHRRRQAAIARKIRLRLAPLEDDVVWSLDATHLGHQDGGQKLMGQLIVDVRSGALRGASLGDPPKAADAVALLKHAKTERGRLPLVLAIDNGYASRKLRSYAAEEGMILLVNLPRTPQHNAWVERAMRSLKEGVRDRLSAEEIRGERALALTDLVLALRESLLDLDARRRAGRRAEGKGESAIDRDRPRRRRYDRELRSRLARRIAWRLERIPAEHCSARRRRLLERHAIFETLLEAGLVSLTRGGRPWEPVAWEELT
ncbi:MAG: transposase family protein [Planctomycetes bacterium]|nr:transposase family protein [Planctomycetota bacterium]